MKEELVTITKEQLEKLKRSQRLLQALQAGGVDNWEQYYEATRDFYRDEYGDEEDQEELDV